jgi:hypothetical protein
MKTLGQRMTHYKNGALNMEQTLDLFCTLGNQTMFEHIAAEYLHEMDMFIATNSIRYNEQTHEFEISPEFDGL